MLLPRTINSLGEKINTDDVDDEINAKLLTYVLELKRHDQALVSTIKNTMLFTMETLANNPELLGGRVSLK